jgi:hypothetical protein
MSAANDAWLVWGLEHPGLGLSAVWSPRAQDVWVGERENHPGCTHDVNRLMRGDLSEWSEGMVQKGVPDELWQQLEPRLDAIYSMFDRTDWGREVTFTERRNQMALLVRAFYGLVMSRRWRFAFFAAPPHFGFDEVLKEVLVWAGVPVIYGFQSLFPDRLWLLREDYRLLRPSNKLSQMVLPPVETEKLFYMLKIKTKSYGGYRVILAWVKYVFGLGRSGQQPFYELKRIQRQRRYQLDDRQAFPEGRRLGMAQLKAESRPFVYFPLHLQPEMTTSALADEGFDSQARVVEELLGALPEGWQLLLKENPKQDWRQRSPAFFARISADPRVYWLDRGIPGKEVIRRSAVVATISGTAGWEAIRMGKPVLLFGRAWYAGFDGVHVWRERGPLDKLSLPDERMLARDFDERMTLCFAGVSDASYLSLSACDRNDNGRQLKSLLDALPGTISAAEF